MKKIVSKLNPKPFKIQLCHLLQKKAPLEFNLPEYKILTNFSDVEQSLNLYAEYDFKFLYFNKNRINLILYDSDKKISIMSNESKIILSDLFYLELLIEDNLNIINFEYPMNLISKIDNNIKKLKMKKHYKKVLSYKTILNLLNYYKGTDIYYKEKDKNAELDEIENNAKIFIKNNIDIFKDFNLNYSVKDFISIKIDKIYINIIEGLIKLNKFENFEYIYNIAEELDLESIEITRTMYEELYEIFTKEEYVKIYIISDLNDLGIPIKINFYYFLLKYIFKYSLYIYQIPILINARKAIMNEIKHNLKIAISNANKNSQEKKEFIIYKLLDSDYYVNKYMKLINGKLLEILYYYKNYLFQSKKNEIKIIEKLLKNEILGNKYDYLKDYKTAKYMNDRFPLILYLFDIKNEKENEKVKGKLNMSEKDINKKFETYKRLERIIKDKKYKKMRFDFKKKLLNYFMDENNKNILNNIFKESDYKDYINANIGILSNKIEQAKKGKKESYELREKNEIKKKKRMEDISNLMTSSKDKTSLKVSPSKSKNINVSELQIEEIEKSSAIIQSIYLQESSSMINFDKNNKTDLTENENGDEESGNLLNIDTVYIDKGKNLFKKSSKYKILEINKKIGNHKMSDLVKNIGKGRYLSTGINNKIRIYDEYFEIKKEIDIIDQAYNTIEMESDNEREIKLLVCCNNYILLFIINSENFNYKYLKYKLPFISCKSILKLNNDLIIMGEAGIYNLNNIFQDYIGYAYKNEISKRNYSGGIQINESLYAFTSNSIIPNGEDILIIYNARSKAIVKSIEEYSFIVSSNGLCLIDININQNNKILLCACRKYDPQQKNGILLINLESNNNNKFEEYFYDTEYFQVNCFCQICNIENENAIGDDIAEKENISISKTNFVLVGGYDERKKEGVIKLYEITENKFIFLQDIEFEYDENFKGFDNSVSCITQSNITGNILVTCWDGNVYLLNPPNIDFYLKTEY